MDKNPRIFARKRLGEKVIAATNAQATMEQLPDTSLSMQSVSYQGT
jgi:hypothetical protein